MLNAELPKNQDPALLRFYLFIYFGKDEGDNDFTKIPHIIKWIETSLLHYVQCIFKRFLGEAEAETRSACSRVPTL